VNDTFYVRLRAPLGKGFWSRLLRGKKREEGAVLRVQGEKKTKRKYDDLQEGVFREASGGFASNEKKELSSWSNRLARWGRVASNKTERGKDEKYEGKEDQKCVKLQREGRLLFHVDDGCGKERHLFCLSRRWGAGWGEVAGKTRRD